MRVLIVGPPGAGKGTLGRLLSGALGVPHISVGALLRSEQRSDAGPSTTTALNKGILVSTELVVEVLGRRMQMPDVVRHGFLLDGFPRDWSQVPYLAEIAPGGQVDALLHLVVDEWIARYRLLQRSRPDDTPRAVRRRMGEYWRETEPMVRGLKASLPSVTVDAAQTPEEVTAQILRGLVAG